ncbi:MAG: hypothetical protein ABR601_07800, partial [Parasphingopyxis sp.]
MDEFAKDGHVLSLRHDFATLKRNHGRGEIAKTGINKTSVFPGFCSKHDSEIFRSLETEPFTPTLEKCSLAAYRAAARERYTKILGNQFNEYFKKFDAGRPLEKQEEIQEFGFFYGSGLQMATSDFDHALELFHRAVERSDYSCFEHLVLEFQDLPVLC